jgi:phosphate transport system permease protein
MTTAAPIVSAPPPAPRGRPRRSRRGHSLLARGLPTVWLTGGALAVCLFMIVGLLALVLYQGGITFWPAPVVQARLADGRVLAGEVTRREQYVPRPSELLALAPEAAEAARARLADHNGRAERQLLRTGNFDLTGMHFAWISDFEVVEETRPEWLLVVERVAWGRFYGTPTAFQIDGRTVADKPATAWAQYEAHHGAARERRATRKRLETVEIGAVNRRLEAARLAQRAAEQRYGPDAPETAAATEQARAVQASVEREFARIGAEIQALDAENARYQLVLTTADGATKTLELAEIVRAYPANRLNWLQQLRLYLARWWEFLADEPREANSEGGVFPAIFGTVAMTLIMSIAVVPLGVLAALYLREYAKAGVLVSAVRIAVNNLAGVPSIVFGVFGLGFFCYLMGGTIDSVFFAAKLPSPTYGTGGILWASLTLALLTLPVVIVATEEALAAVPSSMRDGSYACGASKWQTIRRIVLPRAMPGIMTGTIIAMARGAGEVAPLMLVGAVKLAPELPVDHVWPFVHPERSFMHLGFHIYDLGFQSQNSEAARPMVYTTTLLLIVIIAVLNLAAVWLRARLRRRFQGNQF